MQNSNGHVTSVLEMKMQYMDKHKEEEEIEGIVTHSQHQAGTATFKCRKSF